MDQEKQKNKDLLKWVIIGLAGFVIIILAFGAGVKVGVSKANYSYRWTESYHKNFAGPRGGFLGDWRRFPAGDFISGHGAFGEIIEIKDNGFVIKGLKNVEKVVITNQETTITKGRKTIKDGLKVGDNVVIIGSPNNEGQIEAKLIRVFDRETKGLPYKPFRPIPFF
ncbi:hypothetical protein KJ636_00525 [Patescibacteria group bacterium]|nr:hypothetical protein [Patescibacteria group bacterium]MBU4481638.1 hypothetical protein [Patescibacteria group bacterium]